MLAPLPRRLPAFLAWTGVAALALMVPLAHSTSHACPFCANQGQTLTQEIGQASLVVVGSIVKSDIANGDTGDGTSELQIDTVIKKHEILGDGKSITLARYVPKDPKKKYLVFCDVFKGKIDPYRGMPLPPESDMGAYLKGALAVKDQSVSKRLEFFFKYLDSADLEVSNDAYKEFANADYKDYREMAKHLPADKIAGWLKDPKTPSFRYGLYASMLGHCGTDKHAKQLREMLDDPTHRLSTGTDGVLAGFVMLQPKEGWAYLRGMLKDSSKDFTTRYAALRAARFFHDMRSDLVPQKDVLDAVKLLLAQGDIADLAIEDLRKWKDWDDCDQVLPLRDKESHSVPIIQRAILRYALACPKPAAKAFVDEVRKKDPQKVQDAEELLKLENGVPNPTPAAAK